MTTANRMTLAALALTMLCAMPFAAAGQNIDGDAAQRNALESVFGAFNLTAESVLSESDSETGEPQLFVVRGNVVIISDRMNLICDEVTIDFANQTLLAKGEIVKFSKDGIEGECGVLRYLIDENKAILEGPHKPRIKQRSPDGKDSSSAADLITIIQGEKSNRIQLEGNVEISMDQTDPPPVNGAGDVKPPARKIDRATIGARIRKPPPPKKG